MENLLRQGDDNRPLVRSYPKCRLLLKRTIYLGELVDVSLKGALFAPEHVIENSHNKACRLYLEGIEPAINGIVIQEGILLCIKFLGVRHAEQKTIEMIARDDAPEFAQKIERDMSDLMRRRSGLIQMTMH